MRKVLCLSTSNYNPFPTRKQNVMNRLHDAEVLYVDPPVTYIAPLKDSKAKERLSLWKKGGETAEFHQHVTIYAAPPVLPFYNKIRAINKINQKKFAACLARILNEKGWKDDFTLWVYSPMSADVVDPLAAALGLDPEELWKNTVYDCVDRHSAYPGMINPAVVDGMEEDLARRCGCVFATAQGLYERLKTFNSNCHMIPNGAAYELFSKVADMEKTSTTTTFGFVGMLQECIDYDLLRAVAKAFPDAKMQFIGRTLPGVDISWMEATPNMELVGLVPQHKLPEYLRSFDVCLNVFADNDLSKDVSPLKFYEYLATGKPVVSTPVPYQVRDFADAIYIGENTEDFIEKCRQALREEKGSEKAAARMHYAKACSWDERVKSMEKILGWNQEE